jgi:ABC-2 type transport system ATP-binding protein
LADIIRLEGLRRKFGKVLALDGLSLSVREGEVFGFLGRNGAGKTTTLRMLTGILLPDSGEIHLLGQRVKRVTPTMKRRIGYVSQEQNFYPWMSARELGRFVKGFYPSWDAAEFERLLKVLDVPPDRRSAELSGGSRTKLGLALAMAPRPPLLLLDEPTSGLDPVARHEFNELVATTVKQNGTTAFFSSHLVDEVQHIAHRVGIIQKGRARFEGEVGHLLASVRSIDSTQPLPQPMPEGFTQVRGNVWSAEPAVWDAAIWPEGTTVTSMSLADIFLAFARIDPDPAPSSTSAPAPAPAPTPAPTPASPPTTP